MIKEITLQEGLDEFQRQNENYFSDRPMSEEAKQFLLNHDIAHVIFGCNTSMYGEGIVKIWTTYGTTLSFWKVISGYREVSAFSLARKYSLSHVARSIFRLLWTIPKTIKRARQMTKPWNWCDYQVYLNTPVAEIRKEFNIRVIG